MRLEQVLAGLEAPLRGRLEAALQLIGRQAEGAASLQGRVAALLKADASPVTVVDLLHQTQVQEMLGRRFPGDALVCEEPRELQRAHAAEAARLSREVYGVELETAGAERPAEGDGVWILDPIDGTKGFLGGRYFAIAIGYLLRGEPRFTVMAVPGGDDSHPLAIDRSLAFAVAGGRAWMAPVSARREDSWRVLPARSKPAVGPVRVAVSLAHGGSLAERLKARSDIQVVELDSQAKYLAVAAGDLDAYLRASRDDGGSDLTWDHLPGALIALQAGCTVQHFDGSPIRFEARETIELRGGVACMRERPDGSVARVIDDLLEK